ncbi:MAG: universal stress protein [Deltaproteobacteria bacterium]|nr:universal stress protein [Deltaproteobacteria bacterium]
MTPNSILVPTDFSEFAEHALDYACNLAGKLGATVHLVNALGASLPELNIAMTDAMIEKLVVGHREALEKLADTRRARARIGSVLVMSGDARDVILEAAKTVGADLIVMGTHGRRGVARLMLGSVTENVLRHADCPVLAVRPKLAHKSRA